MPHSINFVCTLNEFLIYLLNTFFFYTDLLILKCKIHALHLFRFFSIHMKMSKMSRALLRSRSHSFINLKMQRCEKTKLMTFSVVYRLLLIVYIPNGTFSHIIVIPTHIQITYTQRHIPRHLIYIHKHRICGKQTREKEPLSIFSFAFQLR